MNYILYGSQYLLIKKQINNIIKNTLESSDEFNTIFIDFEKTSFSEVCDTMLSLPLGVDKQVVVIDNSCFLQKDSNSDKDISLKINDIIQDNDDTTNVIFIVRSSLVNDKDVLYTRILNNGKVFECKDLTKDEWPLYIEKYLKRKGYTIDKNALVELNARIDNDLNVFSNEVAKLILYKDDNKNISLKDIQTMVSKPVESNAFALSNALIKKDYETALSVFNDLKLLGYKYTDSLIPMIANSFRFISQVKYLYNQGYNYKEISSLLKCHEYRVKVSLKNSQYINTTYICESLEKLFILDNKIKSSQIDCLYGLELFIINF